MPLVEGSDSFVSQAVISYTHPENYVSLKISLTTACGSVHVAVQIHPIMPGMDSLYIIERLPMGSPGIHSSALMAWIARGVPNGLSGAYEWQKSRWINVTVYSTEDIEEGARDSKSVSEFTRVTGAQGQGAKQRERRPELTAEI